jgi:predicted XRE-type DNA-binding protein
VLSVVRDKGGKALAEAGTGNVWADLGFRNPALEMAKAKMVMEISRIMERRDMSQVRAGEIMGLPQPKLSALLRGHWSSFSLDRLSRYINKLGADVRISFKDRPGWREGTVHVSDRA